MLLAFSDYPFGNMAFYIFKAHLHKLFVIFFPPPKISATLLVLSLGNATQRGPSLSVLRKARQVQLATFFSQSILILNFANIIITLYFSSVYDVCLRYKMSMKKTDANDSIFGYPLSLAQI
jgi:hypothetical protein